MRFVPPSSLRWLGIGLLAVVLAAVEVTAAPAPIAAAAPVLLSQGKAATASSVENAGTPAAAAVDGSGTTRWSSAFSDPHWLQVDLGARATVNQVVLSWEPAYARAFQVQVSADGIVDAFGLKLAMRLHAHDGYDVRVGEDQATFAEDRAVTFQKFVDAVPAEFDVLARTQAPYRIIAPGSDPSFRAGGVNANYVTAYASSVGVTESTSNIFGCAGSMAGNPDMCAALNRHTAHLPRSQWQDPTRYYSAPPANYYAEFWHDRAIDRLSYGFPYDDVAGQSSFVSHGDPQYLLVAVGW